MKNRLLYILGIILFVVALFFGWLKFHDVFSDEPVPQQSQTTSDQPKEVEETKEPESFDKTAYPVDEPGSIWWVVNRQRPLPDGYVPSNLIVPNVPLRLGSGNEQMKASKEIEPALIEMFNASKTAGVNMIFGSGYRSEALQTQFYNSYVAKDGQVEADRYSARPGTSEHQTGLTFDATSSSGKCHLEICFEDTPEGKWLAENSYKYGFVIRYPDGKENSTGYQYEPWHMRYVGVELATELHKNGQTMEEFFGLEPVPFP